MIFSKRAVEDVRRAGKVCILLILLSILFLNNSTFILILLHLSLSYQYAICLTLNEDPIDLLVS